MGTQRNTTLELFKIFAAYMVVFIHIPFYGNVGIIMNVLARFAVPLFFLISGFYSYKATPEKIKKRALHIIKLFIFAAVCYTLYKILPLLFSGDFNGVISHLKQYISPLSIIHLLFFNISHSSAHLWYLLAAIYVYAIFYFVSVHQINEKTIFVISFSLLLLHIFSGEILSVFGITVPLIFVRNFALMGIPFFALGLFAKKHEHRIKNIPNYIIVIAGMIGIIETILSRFLFGQNELFIGSLFILFAIAVCFIKYPCIKVLPAGILNELSGCNTYIYIFHIMVSSCIVKIYECTNINSSSVFMQMLHPLLVCVVSTAVSYGMLKLKNSIHNK